MQKLTSSFGEACRIYCFVNGAGSPLSIIARVCVHNLILVINTLFCSECFEENSVSACSFLCLSEPLSTIKLGVFRAEVSL